ncbi:MAG: universal stress protein [Rhodospirillales bacterium]|nr:universal stress protein [Rhodospirillales bacterium]
MFRTVLLPIDLNHDNSWKKALATALEICQMSGGSLHVLTVVPDFGMTIVGQSFPAGFRKDVADKTLKKLHEFVSANVPATVKVQHIVGEGTVYEVILSIADKISADLIVMGAHRPDLKDYLLGPNAARVVRHSDCSVMVVRD